MFFNNETANTVQLISLPLEAIGFFLTYVEIWKPKIFYKLENLFVTIYRFTSSFSAIATEENSKDTAEKWGVMITIILLILSPIISSKAFDTQFHVIIYMIIGGIITLSFFVTTWIFLIYRLSNGKGVVGGLGLLLAFLGLLGELYQVITMFST